MRPRSPDRAPSSSAADLEPTRLRAGRPADLLGVVPYLLGFHPEESLVAVLVRDETVVMTGRLDIDVTEQALDLAGYLTDLVRCQHASELVIIVYSRRPDGRQIAADAAAALEPGLLLDALYVDGARWWSVLCDGACCPPEGTPFDLSSNAMSAAAVFAGLTALPDRAALIELVRGPEPESVPELEALLAAADRELTALPLAARRRLVRRLVRQNLRVATLTPADCARLTVLVEQLPVRDVAWAQLSRERADEHVQLWRQVVARTPDRLAAAPLCLLGVAAWVAGKGALQNCCIDRVAEVAPGYSMAAILSEINERALPPAFWDQLAAEFRHDPRLLAR